MLFTVNMTSFLMHLSKPIHRKCDCLFECLSFVSHKRTFSCFVKLFKKFQKNRLGRLYLPDGCYKHKKGETKQKLCFVSPFYVFHENFYKVFIGIFQQDTRICSSNTLPVRQFFHCLFLKFYKKLQKKQIECSLGFTTQRVFEQTV